MFYKKPGGPCRLVACRRKGEKILKTELQIGLPKYGTRTENVACVASVSSRGSPRKLGQEQKKRGKAGEGEGKEGTSSPLPLPLQPFFFCFRSNFRAITRLETLATQATENVTSVIVNFLSAKPNGTFGKKSTGEKA